MTNYRVLIVAIEKPLHAELGGMPSAEADAAALDRAWQTIGIPDDNRNILLGKYATKAAVDSRLRQFKKQIRRGDHAVVAWFGRGHDGLLNCWDSLPDDAPGTSLRIRDLFAAARAWKSDDAIFLLAAPGLENPIIAEEIAGTNQFSALLACASGEESLASPELSGGVWARLVAEAIGGRAPKAREGAGRVTARSLQRYLELEMPRSLRQYFDADAVQTPALLGSHDFELVAARTPPPAAPFLDAARLRRIVFRSESTLDFRDLSGYRKTFSLPAKAGSASRRFVQRLAANDIRAELERVAEASRERHGYRRKDLNLAIGQDGTGSLRTPDFEYSISVDLDTADSSRLTWRRELSGFADPGFARVDFGGTFGPAFDQLVFELAKPLDIHAFVDRMEEAPPPGTKMILGGDARTCELAIRGFAGSILVGRNAVIVRGSTPKASGLLDLLLAFLTRFEPIVEGPLRLAGAPAPPAPPAPTQIAPAAVG